MILKAGEPAPYLGVLTDPARLREDEAFRAACQSQLEHPDVSARTSPMPWLLSGVIFGILATLTVHGR